MSKMRESLPTSTISRGRPSTASTPIWSASKIWRNTAVSRWRASAISSSARSTTSRTTTSGDDRWCWNIFSAAMGRRLPFVSLFVWCETRCVFDRRFVCISVCKLHGQRATAPIVRLTIYRKSKIYPLSEHNVFATIQSLKKKAAKIQAAATGTAEDKGQ